MKDRQEIINNLSGMDFLKTVFLKILSIVLSISFLIGLVVIAGAIAGYMYDFMHKIPDPVARGDDLGGGFVVLFFMFFGVVLSIVLFFPLYKFIYAHIRKIGGFK